jgi:hypothetical protein
MLGLDGDPIEPAICVQSRRSSTVDGYDYDYDYDYEYRLRRAGRQHGRTNL